MCLQALFCLAGVLNDMRQFYSVTTTGTLGEFSTLEFVQPVRKMCLIAENAAGYLRFVYSDGSDSGVFFLPARQVVYLDFQSANNGGGVRTVSLADAGVQTQIRVSVIEYGTGGNIDWYK